MFSMTVSSTPRDLPSYLHLLPITLATKAWQHWSTFSVSIKNKVFVFNSRWNMPAAWFSRHEAAFTRMRTVLNSLVPKMSDWAKEAWNRAQILPTSLTGDVTPDIAEDDWEQGWFFNSLQLVTRFYWKGGWSRSVAHFKQIKDILKFLLRAVWKLKILKLVTKTVNNY